MILLAGLGNPGADYARNRHNIGFMAVDAIVRRHGFSLWRPKFQGEVCEGTIGGIRTVALKPLTYMNESGRSVVAAAQFYKIDLADIIVLHDEFDVAPAKLKVKTGGGHAGHNGLRSIQAHSGADFHRVRLGIGHPGSKEQVHNWVLGNFAKADAEWLQDELDAIAGAAPKLVAKDFIGFMNDVALGMQRDSDLPLKKPTAPRPSTSQAAAADSNAPAAAPARNAMAATLQMLLQQKRPPGRRPGG